MSYFHRRPIFAWSRRVRRGVGFFLQQDADLDENAEFQAVINDVIPQKI